MYTIVLIASLFGNGASVATNSQFYTLEACNLIATKLQNASGLQHKCVPATQPTIK